MDGNPDLETRVGEGLTGKCEAGRYGLPFIGDNSFLPDRIDQLDRVPVLNGTSGYAGTIRNSATDDSSHDLD